MKRILLLILVFSMLSLPLALAEDVEQIWVEDVISPVYTAGDGVSLCLRNAQGHLFMRVEKDGFLLKDTDCGSCCGVFISEPYYFVEPGEYIFTLENGPEFYTVTVIAGEAPCPTEYAWMDF